MAPGLPCAIAAQAACPGRQVVALVGDGGFSMLMAEFVTAVKHDLPIKVVVIKNNVLAQLKVHSTATVTLAIKNVAMSYPAADFYGHPRVKQELHPHNILRDKQAFLVGMLMRFPIDLAIVTGHPAMVGTGPLVGKAVDTGLAIAGRNPVAVDSVGAHLLGFEPLAVQHIRQAAEFGLGVPLPPLGGEAGGGRLKIVGVSVKEATAAFRKAAYGDSF